MSAHRSIVHGMALAVALTACSAAEQDPPAQARMAAPAVFTDIRNDCGGCPDGQRLSGLAMRPTERGVQLLVRRTAPAAVGDRLWLWFEQQPVHPVRLERVAGGWQAAVPEAVPVGLADLEVGDEGGDVLIGIYGLAPTEAVAVVSGGGDRIPEVGYTAASGRTGTAVEGALAAQVADGIAAVQSGFPGLTDDQQALTRLTLTRHFTSGTFRYDLAFTDRPDLRLVAEVSVRFPEIAQHLHVELEGELALAQSLFVLADGVTTCTWMTDGTADCEQGDLPLPVTGLVGLVADPAAVMVEAGPARGVLGEAARCWLVPASTEDGPPEGESCALGDGTLAVNDNLRSGHRLVLVERTDAVEEAAFVVP